MSNIASTISTFKIALGAALLAAIAVQAHAAQTQPEPSPTPKGFECGGEAITGSGAGFKSSQEESENAAVASWLEKAKAVYADASWETAKDAGIQCVKQGLYSKCFANGVPCHPKTPD
jgi:hypothetical protein